MAKKPVKKKPAAKAPVKKAPKPKVVAKPDPFEDEDEAPSKGSNTGIPGSALKNIVDRVIRLTEEQKALGEDIKEVYSEGKAKGLEPKIVRKIVQIKMADKEKLRQDKELLDLYLFALDPELADVLS